MPAKSKKQRRAAGMAMAAKKGKISKSSLWGAASSMMKMSESELKKYAKTKDKGLPKKVKKK